VDLTNDSGADNMLSFDCYIFPKKKNKVLALNPSMQHLTKEGERSCILFEVFFSIREKFPYWSLHFFSCMGMTLAPVVRV
jgi:hypothetical protein